MPEKLSLSPAAICSILEASAKSGVSELKFGGLHVKFGKTAEILTGIRFPETNSYPFVPQNPATAPVNALTEEQHKKQAKESLEMDELLLREEQLAQALVENPSRYEELLAQGDLSDDVDSADELDDE